jgi:hypothetical protein
MIRSSRTGAQVRSARSSRLERYQSSEVRTAASRTLPYWVSFGYIRVATRMYECAGDKRAVVGREAELAGAARQRQASEAVRLVVKGLIGEIRRSHGGILSVG